MERVLFYLPVVTPWWFDNIVVHLIRALSHCAEVHVMVPRLWRNTGLGPEQLRRGASIPGVHWHILDKGDHLSLRTSPADPDSVVEIARSIDPGYVFCRSADITTPAAFPGKICYLMEAGAPPFSVRAGWIILQREFWGHGIIPDLSAEDAKMIDDLAAKSWGQTRNRTEQRREFRLPRIKALQRMGLPTDRRIIALPLEYEHEEAFFSFHNKFERNLDLIHHLAERMEDDFVLAMTDHPLNYKYVDNSKVYQAIAALGKRAHLVPNPNAYYYPTDLLIKHCDGLIVQNTKAIYSGAFFGKPTLRLSHRPSGGWLGVHEDLESFKAAVRSGQDGPSRDDARRWFGFHLTHEIIEAAAISGAEILDRIDRPFSRDRLTDGIERYEAYMRELALAA
jgi:hypothetical protein